MAKETGESTERGFTLGDGPARSEASSEGDGIPKIDFSTFAISLGTSALYHMGIVNDPEHGPSGERNLPLAQQTIDTLEMLAVKTRGNLDVQEKKLLDALLYELRMRFVEIDK